MPTALSMWLSLPRAAPRATRLLHHRLLPVGVHPRSPGSQLTVHCVHPPLSWPTVAAPLALRASPFCTASTDRSAAASASASASASPSSSAFSSIWQGILSKPSTTSTTASKTSTTSTDSTTTPTSDEGTEPKVELSRLLQVAGRERATLSLALAAQLVSATSILAFPLALGSIIDTITPGASSAAGPSLSMLLAATGGVFAVSSAATGARVAALSLAGSRIARDLRTRLFSALLRQDTAYFDAVNANRLINILSNDIPYVSRTLTDNLSKLLRSAITGFASLGMVVYLSPPLAALTLLSLPPLAVLAMRFSRAAKALSRTLVDALAATTALANERILALRALRVLGAERDQCTRYASRIDDTYAVAYAVALADGRYAAATQLAAQVPLLAILAAGSALVADPSVPAMTVGALTSFSMYAANLGAAAANSASAYGQLARAAGSAHRIFEVVDRNPVDASSTLSARPRAVLLAELGLSPDPDVDIDTDSHAMGTILPAGYNPVVSFEDVHFAYPARRDEPVLTGLSLRAVPGEILAVAGASGAGKSTLLALLARLYSPAAGRVTLGGTDVSELDPAFLRAQVAAVPQTPALLGGSVREAVVFGLGGDVVENDVAFFARLVGADTLLDRPTGALSGGQRARIALCQALVRRPKVLVLDEAAAHLDPSAERVLAHAIRYAAHEMGATVISIAHRSASMRAADNVAVMVDGAIAEVAPFETLVADSESALSSIMRGPARSQPQPQPQSHANPSDR